MASDQKDSIFVIISDPQVSYLMDRTLRSAGYLLTLFADKDRAIEAYSSLEQSDLPAVVIIGNGSENDQDLELSRSLIQLNPIQVILILAKQSTPELFKSAMQSGVSTCLCLPLHTDEILKAVHNAVQLYHERRSWIEQPKQQISQILPSQISDLEILTRLGRSITGTFDQDAVFSAIVEAAVELTGAEEGSLLMVDEITNELYMRASRNIKEQVARTFRIPVKDSLAGDVVRTGKPVVLDKNTPQKIKTAYLVRRLLYVPLQIDGHVIGVLGVDNQQKLTPFTERHVQIATSLADFAVIAINNANFYSTAIRERNKLETILTNIQDGVIVIDKNGRVILVNQTAKSAFNFDQVNLVGLKATEIFNHPDLLKIIKPGQTGDFVRREIDLEDGRVFSAHLTPIPEVGLVITLNDISSLKKIDRIKTEFVNTVSHDLRSPLTTILGYVELIDRVGQINDTQREFIHRIQGSVHNISDLVDDLLNLGQIEAGFDSRKEMIQLDQIIRSSADEFAGRINEKTLKLIVDLPNQFPALFGNPIHIRQVVDNLLDNAIKYTPNSGIIKVLAKPEGNQAILQVIDSGIGIPAKDLPYIFDKFYRGANVNNNKNGTGLGLSIVKSIVENHQGRIWVDSVINQGTKFTVILPLTKSSQ
jgi:two-component system, OmpR family, phosphate regulon sensor histidine kinase PhoR